MSTPEREIEVAPEPETLSVPTRRLKVAILRAEDEPDRSLPRAIRRARALEAWIVEHDRATLHQILADQEWNSCIWVLLYED